MGRGGGKARTASTTLPIVTRQLSWVFLQNVLFFLQNELLTSQNRSLLPVSKRIRSQREVACHRSNCPPPQQEGCPPNSSPTFPKCKTLYTPLTPGIYPSLISSISPAINWILLDFLIATHPSVLLKHDCMLSTVQDIRELGM